MIDIYYKNSQGKRIDFDNKIYSIAEMEIYNHELSYESENEKIIGFVLDEIKERSLTINISDYQNIPWQTSYDNFIDITMKDVIENQRGYLYIGDYYMRCNIISMTSEDQFREWCDFQTCEIQIITEKAIWIKEQKIQMLPESPLRPTILMDIQNNAVVREFPFEFVSSYGKYVLNNESAMDSDFIMTMYGYVDNPVLAINSHIYTVKDTIFEGERIVIDSNAGTVIKISKTGLETKIFNARGKQNSVFKKIPPGISNISWPGSYGVDIVVFDERVQPKWSL